MSVTVRFRSPPFPYVGLPRALEKADQLYAAVRHHAAALSTAAKAWETDPKSSATLRTIGALIQYGLLEDEGSGEARKVKLTSLALDIVTDKRPLSSEREAAIKAAALSPQIFQELFGEFGPALDVDASLLIHSLTYERTKRGKSPFSDQSAADVVRVYRETIKYAGLAKGDATNTPKGEDIGVEPSVQMRPPIEVGASVQWVSSGVAQFGEAKRVRALSEDSQWVFVEGSETGIPVEELELLAPPEREAPKLPIPSGAEIIVPLDPNDRNRIKVVWEGAFIQINATVDRAGLARLREKLDAMETLLDD